MNFKQEVAMINTSIGNIEQVVATIPPVNPVVATKFNQEVKAQKIVFTFCDKRFYKSIFVLNELKGEAQRLEDNRFYLKQTRTLVVDNKLYAFRYGSPV